MQTKDSIEIDKINQNIISHSTYRSGLIQEIKVLHQKRKDLRQEIIALSKKIEKTRDSLGDGYYNYKNARKNRREILAKIRELRPKIKVEEEEIRKFERTITKEDSSVIAKRLKEADWKIQTEKLTREEEKQLVQLVKELELKLHLLKQAYGSKQKYYDMQKEMRILQDKMDEISMSSQVSEDEFEVGKDRLANDFKCREQLYTEIDKVNEDISELDQAIQKTDQQLDEIRSKRRDMINQRKKRETDSIKNIEQELLSKAKDEAKDKMAQGKKLTFDELRLAWEDEAESSTPTSIN